MLIRVLIIVLLAGILASLGSGLFYLLKDNERSKRTVRALTVRISLSLVLFALLFVAYSAGWLQPHGVMMR